MTTVLTPIVPTLSTSVPKELVYTAAAASQVMPLSDTLMTMAFIKNTDNSVAHTCTFKHYKTGDSDQVVSITGATAGAVKLAGVWLPYRWANKTPTDAAYGGCELTWSSTTGMSIAVVHVPYASK
jgi:hypothetical protein